jgi:hypothetical protein
MFVYEDEYVPNDYGISKYLVTKIFHSYTEEGKCIEFTLLLY